MPVRRVACLVVALGVTVPPAHRPTATAPAPATAAAAVARPSDTEAPPAGLSREDWGQIRGLMAKGRYHAASVARPGETDALKASNAKQGYVTTFRPEGIEIVSRPVAGTEWRLGVRVTGFGPEGDVRPLAAAKPVAEKERVEYRRGPVTEWYENRPGGLEQSFTIAEPETRESRPLVLAMAVDGGLQVRVEAADEAAFQDGQGRTVVRYAGLKAWDADGQALASRLEASEGQLRVLVEAGEARFPVAVDPIFLQEANLMASDAAPGDLFGSSVSVSGDTAVVGAYATDTGALTNAGSAYVFVRSGTVWSEQQKLTPSDAAASDWFGRSVSISGDTAVVGAHGDDNSSGSAYVFVRSGTVWSQQQKLLASDRAAGDQLGVSVSLSGDTAVVGAPADDTGGGVDAGSAYVFVRSGTLWSQQQKLTASDGAASDYFGISVSVSGDTAVVGASEDDTAGGTGAGSAYVFARSGTLWSQQQKLTASDGAGGDRFGRSVSRSGDTVMVGAWQDDTGGGTDAGSAYVFVWSGTVWNEQQKLTASDVGRGFGYSVSASGDMAVVGAVNGRRAYVFVRSGAAWSEQQTLAPFVPGTGEYFGYSVSFSGDTAVVGANGDDTTSGVDAGSAYVFRTDLIFKDGFEPVAGGLPETGDSDEASVPDRDGDGVAAASPR